jgi:hypothetical protein
MEIIEICFNGIMAILIVISLGAVARKILNAIDKLTRKTDALMQAVINSKLR